MCLAAVGVVNRYNRYLVVGGVKKKKETKKTKTVRSYGCSHLVAATYHVPESNLYFTVSTQENWWSEGKGHWKSGWGFGYRSSENGIGSLRRLAHRFACKAFGIPVNHHAQRRLWLLLRGWPREPQSRAVRAIYCHPDVPGSSYIDSYNSE